MVPNGFKRFGVWTFEIYEPFWKSNIDWSQHSSTEKVSTWYFMILTKNCCLQNIKIKLNSRTWMIFQALEPVQPYWPHQPYFTKKVPGPEDWIISGTKKTNNGPFLRNGSWSGEQDKHTNRVYYPLADTKLLVVVAVGDVMSKLPNPLLHFFLKKRKKNQRFWTFQKLQSKKCRIT